VRPLPRTARKPITRLKVRKPESPSKYINSEARKVSTELEKVMDEAFNRSSMGSSRRTSTMEAPQHGMEYDTPLTSFSNRDSGGTALATPGDKSVYQNRPLPPTPKETPNTFLQRKLAETRAEIAQRFADAGDHTENISLVLDKLDRLIVPSTTGGMRVCSAPAKSPEQPGPLHVIPEEARTDTEERYEFYDLHQRAVTDPIRPGLQGRRAVTEQHTIRLVDQSPTRVAPLNIRKKSGASMSTKSGRVNALPVVSQQPSQNDAPAARTPLEPPLLASAVQEPKEPTVKKKKSSWFRRNLEEKERPQESQPKPASTKLQIPEKWYGLDDRIKNDAPKATGPSPDISKLVTKQSNASESSEFPMRNCVSAFGKSEGNGGLKGLFGLFGRKTKEEKNRRALELGGKKSRAIP
jgi:serine/threonine-protein kinase HSL1 (negative regulator of Swe1 kinase)